MNSIFFYELDMSWFKIFKWHQTAFFYVLVILFEIDCAIFYTNLQELICQFISSTNWVNSGKFMDNCWISCQVMVDMKKVYNNLIIINLYLLTTWQISYLGKKILIHRSFDLLIRYIFYSIIVLPCIQSKIKQFLQSTIEKMSWKNGANVYEQECSSSWEELSSAEQSQSRLWKMWATNRCQTGSKDPCQLECMIGF